MEQNIQTASCKDMGPAQFFTPLTNSLVMEQLSDFPKDKLHSDSQHAISLNIPVIINSKWHGKMHGYKPETRVRSLKTIHILPTNLYALKIKNTTTTKRPELGFCFVTLYFDILIYIGKPQRLWL